MADTTALDKLEPELFPEEKLLWSGRPVQGIRFQLSDLWGYAVGAFLLSIMILLLLLVLEFIPMPDSFLQGSTMWGAKCGCAAWIVILLPVAMFCLGGSQWLDSYMRSRLFYGVTNERILIVREMRRNHQSVTSLRLTDVPHLTLTVGDDAMGSLSFVARAANTQNHPSALGLCFRLIPEVRKVYTLIRSVQRTAA